MRAVAAWLLLAYSAARRTVNMDDSAPASEMQPRPTVESSARMSSDDLAWLTDTAVLQCEKMAGKVDAATCLARSCQAKWPGDRIQVMVGQGSLNHYQEVGWVNLWDRNPQIKGGPSAPIPRSLATTPCCGGAGAGFGFCASRGWSMTCYRKARK